MFYVIKTITHITLCYINTDNFNMGFLVICVPVAQLVELKSETQETKNVKIDCFKGIVHPQNNIFSL